MHVQHIVHPSPDILGAIPVTTHCGGEVLSLKAKNVLPCGFGQYDWIRHQTVKLTFPFCISISMPLLVRSFPDVICPMFA
ncbi:hypothetical protein Brsp07_04741 [Brucella sp. NBRC 14130]|uniref:Uncharacterized protein n=1 Tax=Brucella intermedia TaxID=94625 RepID=A0A7V6U0G1_9HYPH|nr:hypothetical protein [Brucella intermedia]